MKRIYFLVPDQDSAQTIVNELRTNGIEEEHISIIAKQGESLPELPEETKATFLEKSDWLPALQRGVGVGGSLGLFAGLTVLALQPAGLLIGGGALLAGTTVAGATFGAWASSLIGISTPNTQLQQFEEAVANGQILMLVDVPKERINEIQAIIKKHHPEVNFQGVEPAVKVIPKT